MGVELSDVLGHVDDGRCGPKVGGHVDGGHVGVALSEGQDVVDRRASPLVDGLVVIAHDGDLGAALRKEVHEFLLHRIDVLVLIHEHVLDALLKHRFGSRPLVLTGLKPVHDPAQEFGIVEHGVVVQQFAVLVERLQSGLGDLVPVQLVFTQNVEHGVVVSNVVLVPPEVGTTEVLHRTEARLVRVALNQQLGLDLVHHPVLQELIEMRLHELKAPAVNRPDVHLNKAGHGHAGGLDGLTNTVVQFSSSLLGEGERYDAAGRCTLSQQAQDALHEHLGLARTGTRNDLQVAVPMVNRLLLSGRERHQAPSNQYSTAFENTS